MTIFPSTMTGGGLNAGGLVDAIKTRLAKRDGSYQARWDKVWSALVCQRYPAR